MSGLNVARWALVFLCVLGSVGSPSLAANSGPSPTVLIADDYLLRLAAAFPEAGTANDLPGTDHGALSDNSLQGLARWQAYEDATIARLLATPVGASGPESDLILRAALLDDLQRNAGVRVCRLELWGVASYVNGWQAWLTDLARIQPVGTAAHRESALRRARAIPRYLDNEISLLELGLREGYSSPKVIVREVIVQLDGLLAAEPAKSPFSAPAERDADPAFKAAYVAVVRDEINPAVRRYRDFLEKTYLPAARDALGVSANPNGRACYDAVVRQFSTVAMPADEVYETGQRELRRLDEEMRPLAQKLAGTDDVTQAMRVVTTDPRFMFRSSDAVIAYAQAAQDRALAAMPRAFGVYTRVPVKIEPYPEFRARAGAPGQYMPPPEDGSRPPIHLINTWDPTHKSRSIVESTTFHETWPGHHQQTMVAREAPGQHLLLRALFNSGFGEGWALYAERVADELDLYSGDLDRFGYLASAKFRAARMVLDSGIHTRGMGYEEAIALLTRHSTRTPEEVRGEVNRYISWPGQAPSYMIGNLEILRLREDARAAMGERFDVREFHDQVLTRGNVTLPLLRQLVEEWVARAKPVPQSGSER
jgi:uncharacterized protein (DUF885 family)